MDRYSLTIDGPDTKGEYRLRCDALNICVISKAGKQGHPCTTKVLEAREMFTTRLKERLSVETDPNELYQLKIAWRDVAEDLVGDIIAASEADPVVPVENPNRYRNELTFNQLPLAAQIIERILDGGDLFHSVRTVESMTYVAPILKRYGEKCRPKGRPPLAKLRAVLERLPVAEIMGVYLAFGGTPDAELVRRYEATHSPPKADPALKAALTEVRASIVATQRHNADREANRNRGRRAV